MYKNETIDDYIDKNGIRSDNKSQHTNDEVLFIQWNIDKEIEKNIIEKKSSIDMINNDVRLLHQMFADINKMITEQGETIDVICDNTEDIKINVIQAEKDLGKAQEYKTTNKIVGSVIGIFAIISTYIGIKLS